MAITLDKYYEIHSPPGPFLHMLYLCEEVDNAN